MTSDTIGVDISKDHLDAHRLSDGTNRRFAEATGKLAKTDRLDAAMLARMGALLELESRPARSHLLDDLKDLHMARDAPVKNRTAARNRARNLTLPILARRYDILVSIPGLATITASQRWS